MTAVTVLRAGDGISGLVARGHAGYDEEGRDIVCAAVSTLMTTAANALESVAGIRPVVKQNERLAQMMVALPGDLSGQQFRDGQLVLATVLQGLTSLAREYPHYLKIT